MNNCLVFMIQYLLWTSCISQKVSECKEPDIDFGEIVSDGKAEYHDHDRIQYKCSPGYTLEGSDWIECEEEKWNPQPKCLAPCSITKRELEDKNLLLSNGHTHSELVENNQTVEFVCKSGYVLIIPSVRHCVDGQIDLPVCVPASETSDHEGQEGEHLTTSAAGEQKTEGAEVETSAGPSSGEGEHLTTSAAGEQKTEGAEVETSAGPSSGEGESPHASAICTTPKVDNGSFRPVESQYRFEDDIEIFCNQGYEPESQSTTSKCTKYGWSPSPTCVPKRCVYPHLENGILSWANVYYKDENFPKKEGQTIDFRCYHGFLPENKKEWYRVTCTKLGWDPEPQCFKQCIPPPHLPNGHVTSTSTNIFIEGDDLSFECDEGYHPEHEEGKAKCTKDNWSPPPSCVSSSQPPPEEKTPQNLKD